MWWLGLEARKLWYTFVPFGPSYRLHAPRYFWASAVSLLLLLPAAAYGLARAPSGTRPAALLTLAASTILVGLVFFPHERFRLPGDGSGAHRRGRALRVANAPVEGDGVV